MGRVALPVSDRSNVAVRPGDETMKIIVVGHGMVGHKFLEEMHQLQVPGYTSPLCVKSRARHTTVCIYPNSLPARVPTICRWWRRIS